MRTICDLIRIYDNGLSRNWILQTYMNFVEIDHVVVVDHARVDSKFLFITNVTMTYQAAM